MTRKQLSLGIQELVLSCRVWLFSGAAVSAFFALVLVIVSVVSMLPHHSPLSPAPYCNNSGTDQGVAPLVTLILCRCLPSATWSSVGARCRTPAPILAAAS